MGAKEGAQLGAMIGAGQGGSGALWRHGRRKELIKWLMNKAGAGLDDAAPAVAKAGAQASDEVVQALMGADPNLTEDAARHLATAIAGKATPAAKKVVANIPQEVEAARTTQAATKAMGGPKVTKVKGGNFGEATPEQVRAKVLSWKHKQKFSDDVIVDTMREQFGIPNSQGKQLLQMILAE
jgi:hypothetical protein